MAEGAKATMTDVSAVRKRLEIEVPASDVTDELDRAYDALRRHAHLRGFRKGRVPRSVLERYYGEQVRRDVMGRLVEASFRQAIEKHALAIVGSPEIDAETIEAGAPFRYTVVVDVPPAIELGDVSGIAVERPRAAVADADVEAAIGRLREGAAQLRPIEDRVAVAVGDVVTVDVTSRLGDGEPQTRSDVMIEAGAGSFPAAMENQLVDLPVGAHRELTVAYPEDYAGAGLAGRSVHFEVDVKAIHAKELPPLDDDFARDHGAADSLEALREKIRGDLETQADAEAEHRLREALVDALVERHSFEAPPSLVDRRVDAMLSSIGVQVPEGGAGAEALARLRGEIRPRAERDVRADLLLDEIARATEVVVGDDEIDAAIEQQAAHDRQPDRVRSLYAREEAREMLRTRLARARALDHVRENALVTDVEAPSQVAPSSGSG